METPLIFKISHYSILIAFISCLLYYLHLTKPLKYFAILMIIGTVTEFISTLISGSNHWIMNLYDVVEFVFLLIVFYSYKDILKTKKVLFFIIGFFLLGRTILTLSGLETIYAFKSYMLVFSNITIIGITAATVISDNKKEKIPTSKFWLLSGILIYTTASFVVSMFILLFGNQIIEKIYYIHAYANITANIIYAYAFYMDYRIGKLYSSKLVETV